ncbi:MAG: GAF domain-containing protein, partial [Coleofasciculus sp. S288]|nr:GAF domain-containing protein [Coleofasciculus sp. S288]
MKQITPPAPSAPSAPLPPLTLNRKESIQPDIKATEKPMTQKLDQPEQTHNSEPQLDPLPAKTASVSEARIKAIPTVDIEQYFKRERQWLFNFANRIRRVAFIENIDALLETAVTEVREHFKVDRVLIYRFQSETQGVVLAESMTPGYAPSLKETLPAIAFGAENQIEYYQRQVIALERISQSSATPYQLQLCKRFQVEACLSLPIILERQVWGLIVLQQCTSPRVWPEVEINLLYQVVTELTLNLQPVELRLQQQQLTEKNKVVGKVVAKVL